MVRLLNLSNGHPMTSIALSATPVKIVFILAVGLLSACSKLPPDGMNAHGDNAASASKPTTSSYFDWLGNIFANTRH